jgi:hypothetical protein
MAILFQASITINFIKFEVPYFGENFIIDAIRLALFFPLLFYIFFGLVNKIVLKKELKINLKVLFATGLLFVFSMLSVIIPGTPYYNSPTVHKFQGKRKIKDIDTDMGKYKACMSHCRSIAKAINKYAEDHNGEYPDKLDQLIPKYLKQIPTCPTVNKDTYSNSYEYIKFKGNKWFIFYCEGDNHSAMNLAPNYPRYTADKKMMDRPGDEDQ